MRAILFETVTGRFVHELEYASCSWDTGILAPDSLKLAIPAYTPRARSMRLAELLIPRKYGIALVHAHGHVVAAGYITSLSLSQDDDGFEKYAVQARGIEGLFDGYHVRKYPGWPLVDAKNKPVKTHDLTIKNVQYGTMMKRLLVEAQKWGSLPITFEPDRTGTREKSWLALDGKPVLEAIDDISNLENGVEYDFVPAFDGEKVTFKFITGTDTSRIIIPSTTAVLPLGGGSSRVGGFERETVSSDTHCAAYFTGGKSDDKVLIARATSTTLTGAGLPYRELWNTSHSTVSVQNTIQAYASGAVQKAGIVEEWKCQVRATDYPTLRHGDQITIDARDSSYLPTGEYTRRVLSTAGSSSSGWLNITLI